jgi:nicotinamide riboside kinase
VNTLETTFQTQSSWNFVRMIVLMMSRSSSNLGHVGFKSRSLGQITKNLVNTLETTFLNQSSWNFVRMIVLMKSRSSLNLGHVGSKSRSLGQISQKPCEHYKDHIFNPIFMKLCQNDCIDDVLVKFESGSCGVKK